MPVVNSLQGLCPLAASSTSAYWRIASEEQSLWTGNDHDEHRIRHIVAVSVEAAENGGPKELKESLPRTPYP